MNDICRLCLGKRAKRKIFGDDTTIHEKLLSYCKLNVSKNDGLPENVCCICVKKLENVVNFIDKCEESDRVLRNKCGLSDDDKLNSSEIKEEPYTDIECSPLKCPDSDEDDDAFIQDIKNDLCSSKDEIIKEEDKNPMFLSLKKEDYIEKTLFTNLSESNSSLKLSKHKLLGKNLSKIKKSKSNHILDRNLSDRINLVSADVAIAKLEDDCEIKKELDIINEVFNESINEVTKSLKKAKRKRNKILDTNEKKKRNRSGKYEDESQLCFTCGKSFPRSNYLRQHILKHSGVMHKCSQCPKTFATRELMKVHERRHVQVKNFPCQACGHTFTSGYLAKKHHKMVHEKNYAVACKLCDKVLSNPRSLSEHMKIHTGERNFECAFCKRKFAHKLSLVCHTRVHTGEQPYVCQFCDKRFAILKSLKEHERLHTGEKPYACPLCPKRFEQLGNMKSHFRYNHKGLDLKEVQEAKALVKVS